MSNLCKEVTRNSMNFKNCFTRISQTHLQEIYFKNQLNKTKMKF